MSLQYNGVVLTMHNYEKVLTGLSPDVVDEVRLALWDDTPIDNYISMCKDDSYRLGQLRLMIREYVPTKYVNPYISGQNLHKIRKCINKGVDISQIDRYVDKKKSGLTDEGLGLLLDAIYGGADITSVDFFKVPYSNYNIICEGLKKNYPMWLFQGETLPEDRIRLLMRGMALGLDVQPLMHPEWDDTQIRTIYLSAKKIDISELLCRITHRFSKECIEEVIYALANKLNVAVITIVDDEGYPLYNEFQMEALNLAMSNGVVTAEMQNPNLSDMDIRDMVTAEIEKVKAKRGILGGALPK